MLIIGPFDKRERVRTPVGDLSLTKQADKESCDINFILKRFERTGVLEHVSKHGAEYGYADAIDFKSAMDIVAKGNSMFADLPAHLRAKFDSPEGFLDFVQDPANEVELIELGLATRKPDVILPGEEVLASPGEPLATPASPVPTTPE